MERHHEIAATLRNSGRSRNCSQRSPSAPYLIDSATGTSPWPAPGSFIRFLEQELLHSAGGLNSPEATTVTPPQGRPPDSRHHTPTCLSNPEFSRRNEKE